MWKEIEKEYSKWNGNGEYYDNVSKALDSVKQSIIKSLEE